MGKEIERKFLVNDNVYHYLYNINSIYNYGYCDIVQGYINGKDTVRVRTVQCEYDRDPKAYLTLKSKREGFTRKEYEFEIDWKKAEEIIESMCENLIKKERHAFRVIDVVDGGKWEVDIFKEDNDGLIIAEIELKSEDQELFLPNFIEEEVTQDDRYYNYNLSKIPYKEWKQV